MSERLQNPSDNTLSPRLDRLLDPSRSNGYERLYIEKLQKKYDEPHRYAHTFERAVQKAAFIEVHRDSTGVGGDEKTQLRQATVVRWAALYSDISFNPFLSDEVNKSQSAAAATKDLSIWLYSSEVDKITKLICGTHEDLATCDDPDLPLFLDADLSILGSSPDEYKKYAANIRQESDHLSNRDFSKQRAEFLKELLKRERIFVTDTAYSTLESQAKWNIIAELDYLGY